MRLAIVKTLFYSYGVDTGCYVGLDGVFNKFKESIFYSNIDISTLFY